MLTVLNQVPRQEKSRTEIRPESGGESMREAHRKNATTELGVGFESLAERFRSDGLLILYNLLSAEVVRELQGFFEACISLRPYNPVVAQKSFNASADRVSLDASAAIDLLVHNPLLRALVDYYFGAKSCLAFWRGYRLFPRPPIRYRAWDWHNDQKRNEVKALLLLSDVEINGQAMEYAKGTHLHWWNIETQRDTKYSMDEVLTLGRGTVTRCVGKAGSIILFDTNGIHRGTRSTAAARDILAFNFVEERLGAPIFPLLQAGRSASSERIERAQASSSWLPLAHEIHKALADVASQSDWNDSKPADANDLRQRYACTPTFHELRRRLDHSQDLEPQVHELIRNDLHSDLDLIVRLHDGDVLRDIAIAYVRDSLSWEGPWKVVARKPSQVGTNVDLAEISDHARGVAIILQAIRNYPALRNHQSWELLAWLAALANDIGDAILWTESAARLRTNLAFLVGICTAARNAAECICASGAHDHLQELLEKHSTFLQTYTVVAWWDDTASDLVKFNVNLGAKS